MITCDGTGAFVTEHMARFAMSELVREEKVVDHVIMHPIQTLAVLHFFRNVVDVRSRPMEPGEDVPLTSHSFIGIRVVEDTHFPNDRIEMRNSKGETLVVLTNLAVPEDPRKALER